MSFFSQGFGGFESYFIGTKLYYRVLPPSYNHPSKYSSMTL